MRQMRSYPAAADLEDPLYYLQNMDTLVAWVVDRHSDLLSCAERERLAAFAGLATGARALLTRLVMRTGELFRADKLRYPELPVPEAEALVMLQRDGWLDSDPEINPEELFRLYTLPELRAVFGPWLQQQGLPRTLTKAQLRERVAEAFPDSRSVRDWLAGGDQNGQASVVRVQDMGLFDRIRLMFFGNLRQSWTDFVLVELGVQQFEPVPFTPESRAFQQRAEVDAYLKMHYCREQLDEGVPAAEVWPQVPPAPDNAWLASRRDRLLLELGRQAERQGDRELALAVWATSGHREARLKQLRLLERMKRFEQAWTLACEWRTGELSDAEAQGLARLLKRLAPKVGVPAPQPPETPEIPRFTLTLQKPASGTVEWAALEHLTTDEAPVFYVENTLINALFGLLCWPGIFRPLPGAFFHPFHIGPADLTREDFVPRRQTAFEECFRLLRQGGYRERILETYRLKHGIANPFVIWPVLDESLLSLALDCIPPRHLERLFRRLLNNIKEHRSGFPDLIRLLPDAPDTDARYEMIEVKGPGDRLQDHQVRWLAFFAGEGMPASVCYVRWQESEVSE
ncbi:VRR-NUC domain-containing protein [Marinobacter nauticus]